MVIRESKSRKVFNIFNVLLLLGLVVVTLYPLLYVLFASLSDSDALMRNGGNVLLRPLGFTFNAYKIAFRNEALISGFKNTMFVLVVGTVLSLALSSLGAYFMSRKGVLFKGIIIKLIMFTMFFSGGLIPLYITVRDLHLIDSLWALILPSCISTYNMIILRTGFESIPVSLEESARIDGAGHLYILWHIVIPLSKATLAVIALYYGVTYWNAWFHASIFLQGDSSKWPLQLILREILIENTTGTMASGIGDGDVEKIGESIKHAVTIIATAPILCVYPFIQKYFAEGVMLGAVKG